MFVQPISDQCARDMEAPASRPSAPRGHVVGHRVGAPLPTPLSGRPRGHVVGRRVGAPLPSSRPGRSRGHVVGRAVVTDSSDD